MMQILREQRRGTWKTAVPRTRMGSSGRAMLEQLFRCGKRISVPVASEP